VQADGGKRRDGEVKSSGKLLSPEEIKKHLA
jgi:hypothetical protein